MNKKTAWYNEDILPQDMVDGANGKKGWPKLEHSTHFKILKELIELCNSKNIADLGCGAGELGRIYSNMDYTGFDLPHIIELVSKKVNPNLNYVKFDANNFNYSDINKFDLIVCNGFISELPNPIPILKKIIENTKKFLIIHRQFFGNKTELKEYKTYGKLNTIINYISITDFNDLIVNHTIIKEYNKSYGKSILLKLK